MADWKPINEAPLDRPIEVYQPRISEDYGSYKGPARWDGQRWRKLHRRGFVNMTAYPTHFRLLSDKPSNGSETND